MDALALIKRSGRSQRSIAKEIGTSPSNLGDVLHGRRPFRMKWVLPFCKAVGCSPNELFEYKCCEQISYLSNQFTRLAVVDTESEIEIAVVTNNMITTAKDNIVVKFTPSYD